MTQQKQQIQRDDFAGIAVNRTLAIFLISVAGLFIEMLLIRWIGTEIRIFAYLQNTILVVCFLGLGMGCFTCRKPVRINRLLVPLLITTGIMAIPFTRLIAGRITELLSKMTGFVIWFEVVSESPLDALICCVSGSLLTFGLMILVWEMFVPIGRILGRLMDDHPHTIYAYSVNVAGSLVGILLFVLASALYLPPFAWFLIAGLLLVPFLGQGSYRNFNVVKVVAIAVLAWFAGLDPTAYEVVWSPYQKLVLKDIELEHSSETVPKVILVNNVGYQNMGDLSNSLESGGELNQYDLPTLIKPEPNKVLIVGAGSGNDVAGVLRGGAKNVTAVEIDPAIIDLGSRFHPEKPYATSKVRCVNDDARSFFSTTKEKFDLVVFGYLDSHTTTSMTNARLDHYVYTRESIQRAKSLLNDGGVLMLSFAASRPYIADRMGAVIRDEFGREPLFFDTSNGGWGATFVAGDTATIEASLASNERLRNQISDWQSKSTVNLSYSTKVTTDDWPYLYLEGPSIPLLYFVLAALLIGLFMYGCKRLEIVNFRTGWQVSHWHFFFLGAAFMLLEVQNISKAAVVFGNTWSVNAIIVSAILIMILAANLVAARFPSIPFNLVAMLLIGSCLGLYFLDLSQFGALSFVPKVLVVGGLTTLPILFSGIVFIRSFDIIDDKSTALGANLLGSLFGGLLQSVTFLVGIKALLLIVGGLYVAAVLTRPRQTTRENRSGEKEATTETTDAERLEPVLA